MSLSDAKLFDALLIETISSLPFYNLHQNTDMLWITITLNILRWTNYIWKNNRGICFYCNLWYFYNSTENLQLLDWGVIGMLMRSYWYLTKYLRVWYIRLSPHHIENSSLTGLRLLTWCKTNHKITNDWNLFYWLLTGLQAK